MIKRLWGRFRAGVAEPRAQNAVFAAIYAEAALFGVTAILDTPPSIAHVLSASAPLWTGLLIVGGLVGAWAALRDRRVIEVAAGSMIGCALTVLLVCGTAYDLSSGDVAYLPIRFPYVMTLTAIAGRFVIIYRPGALTSLISRIKSARPGARHRK